MLHWRLRDMAFDDSYIHLRIARNLFRTGHAYFNSGERVMATSLPVWTVLLYALRIPHHLAWLPVVEAFLAWAVVILAAAITWRTACSLPRASRIALAIAAGVLAFALMVVSSMGQMETPLAIAFLLGAWLAAIDDRPESLPLLALAACTRLGLLPLLCVGLLLGFRRHRLAACIAVAIVAAFCLWTFVQFGVLLPNSMKAKTISYGLTISSTFHEFVAQRLREELLWPLLPLLSAVALWQCVRGPRTSRTQWLNASALCASLGLMLIYVVHRTAMFPWYRPLYSIPLMLGLLLYRGGAFQRPWRRVALAVVQSVLLIFFFVPDLRLLDRYVIAAIRPTAWNKSMIDGGDSARVVAYREVGDVLRSRCPGSRLMVTEMGALGWAFGGHVDDAVGIASPDALPFQPLHSGARLSGIPAAYVERKMPDTVVDYAALDTEMFLSHGLDGRYDLIQLPTSPRDDRGGLIDRGWRGSRSLNVWLRRDRSCDTGAVRAELRDRFE